MSPQRWARVKEVFAAARDVSASQRAAYLDAACGADGELRIEVERMLAHDDEGSLHSPAAGLLGGARRFAPGDMVGPYRVEVELGQGGMGVVYRAFDTRLRRSVAFKVLPPEDLADPDRKQRLLREARAASALNHPNIVTVHEVGSDSGVDFIAMEFVEGKTLDAVIPPKGLPLEKALDYAIQIAGGLAKAHAAGVVHRDLKPGNIMVTGSASGHAGLVKLVDFGLARQVQPGPVHETTLTLEGTIMGTPAYMSPEQAQGTPADERSDVFSFGVVLYEMLSGRRAFSGDSAAAVVAAVLREEAAPLGGRVPPDLEKIVRRCLRKDPDRRFQSMADLRVALQDVSEESQVQPVGGSPPKRRRFQRSLWVAISALAVLAPAGWWLRTYLEPELPEPRLVQLTAYQGNLCCPSFSPDGKQVAFAWTGEKGDHSDIYVKMVGETNALRLTTGPAEATFPAWSPDGKRIAFGRGPPANGIWTMSPLGGKEQKLADFDPTRQMSWSPDGKWLAAARVASAQNPGSETGLYLVPSDGSEPRRISNPKPPAYDRHPSFSPDGRFLAYASCSTVYSCDLSVQEFDSGYSSRGNPRRITHQGFAIAGIAWSRDGGSLIYSASASWGVLHRMWRVDSSGKREPKRYDLAGFGVLSLSIAPTGDRMAFTRREFDLHIRRYQAGEDPKPFLASSVLEYGAQFSPDGSRVAFCSGRSGDQVEVWVAGADGTQPVQLTSGLGHGQCSPNWSPDGRLIAFDSLNETGQSKIYVIDAGGGRPRLVSSGAYDDSLPTWSRDGKWICFTSDRTGRPEIWRVPAGGGQAHQITQNGGWLGIESRDGNTLFYSYQTTLYAKRLDDGAEERILDSVSTPHFAPVEDGIYYIGWSGSNTRQYSLRFYDFATRTSRLLTNVEGIGAVGFSVSPDRKTILYCAGVHPVYDLMMIENFR